MLGDRRHLAPLLEFIRFISQEAHAGSNRFPKRLNGVRNLGSGGEHSFPLLNDNEIKSECVKVEVPLLKEDVTPTEEEENARDSPEFFVPVNEEDSEILIDDGEADEVPVISVSGKESSEPLPTTPPICVEDTRPDEGSSKTAAAQKNPSRKRGRPATDRRKKTRKTDDCVSQSSNLPMHLEILSKATQKGVFQAKYVDLPLSSLGAIPLFDPDTDTIDRKTAKQSLGKKCCYLMLGSTMIVTGSIVDIDVKEGIMQVVADKGLSAGIDWIEMDRLYYIPENLSSVRREAMTKIKEIMARIQLQQE